MYPAQTSAFAPGPSSDSSSWPSGWECRRTRQRARWYCCPVCSLMAEMVGRALPISISQMRISEKSSPEWEVNSDRSKRVVFFIAPSLSLNIPENDSKKHSLLFCSHWPSAVREAVPGASSLLRGDCAHRPTARAVALCVQDVSTPVDNEPSLACLLV